ncbi:GIY-YIG nuclease family protein [Rosistilla oblonga]|uniref:GIY-YIG nuclease family protein n=1 Tax=Rosistilla oblonga TaxID=2527990 RepID=UPI003A96C4CA
MTSPTAKTIQIYLPTGEPRGIRIAEITTRIVQAVLIPRSDLAQGKLRKELDLPGIYFLFGEGEDEAKPIVYIGQTEDARKRFDRHNKTKTFWKTAVFCVSKTQNFTQAHIRYLEWYCMQRAKEVNRYSLDNGQVPDNSTYVPEPMEAELLDVFETVSTLVSTLGYPVFEPVVKQSSSSIIFYCRGGGSEGKGELVEDGFVVHEGSKARMEVVTSAIASVTPRRDKLRSAGVMEERNGEYVFTQDYLFTSPSTAAAVVLGRSANGWVEWKDKNGATLSEVHRDDEAETGDEE